jgi:hypothetical protein
VLSPRPASERRAAGFRVVHVSGDRVAVILGGVARGRGEQGLPGRLARPELVRLLATYGDGGHSSRYACPLPEVTSELVTNAIGASAEAGNPVVRLRVTSRMHAVLVSVWDASERQPAPRRDGAADDLGGRGLVLVEALADHWGTEPAHEGGKTVFAVLA